METKTYYLYGYAITRRYHYVDAYQHYLYQVNHDGTIADYKSLNEAKDAIRKHLGLKTR